MPTNRPVAFGRFEFPSTKAAIAAISKVLNKHQRLQRISDPEDDELLHEVLKKHPHALEKTKGLKIVGFEVHPYIRDGSCFYLCRSDGTKEHFGFQKCVRNAARV